MINRVFYLLFIAMNLSETYKKRLKEIAGIKNQDDKVGKEFWFEYHCNESPASPDAPAWYHSHQKVLVLRRGNDEHDKFPEEPKIYTVRFNDGLEWDVFDDELLNSPQEFYRPDPPKKR